MQNISALYDVRIHSYRAHCMAQAPPPRCTLQTEQIPSNELLNFESTALCRLWCCSELLFTLHSSSPFCPLKSPNCATVLATNSNGFSCPQFKSHDYKVSFPLNTVHGHEKSVGTDSFLQLLQCVTWSLLPDYVVSNHTLPRIRHSYIPRWVILRVCSKNIERLVLREIHHCQMGQIAFNNCFFNDDESP